MCIQTQATKTRYQDRYQKVFSRDCQLHQAAKKLSEECKELHEQAIADAEHPGR